MAFIYLPGTTMGGLPVAMPTIGSVDGGSAPAKEQGRGERQGFAPCFPVACGAIWGNRTVGLFLFWLAAAFCALWEIGGNVGLVEITEQPLSLSSTLLLGWCTAAIDTANCRHSHGEPTHSGPR